MAEAIALGAATAVVAWLGWWRWAPLAGRAFGGFVGGVLGVRRRHVLASMECAGVPNPETQARRMYAQLGQALFELLGLALHPWRRASRHVEFVRGDFDRAAGLGRGVVVLTAHTGNWDLTACAAAEHTPLTVVTKRLSIGLFDRLWSAIRRSRGVRLVSAGSVRAVTARELQAGGTVAFLIDQAPERARGTTVAPFLGQPARVDLAGPLLAARAKAPVVLVLGRRRRRGQHVAEVAAVYEPPERPGVAWAEDVARRVTAELDQYVRRHPDQWLWMHRRWKDAPVDSAPGRWVLGQGA